MEFALSEEQEILSDSVKKMLRPFTVGLWPNCNRSS